MLNYEILDTIADTYIPALAAISLYSLTRTATLSRWRLLGIHSSVIVIGLLIAYGLMFFDAVSGAWPAFGLDYSTHTAVAFVTIVFLVIASNKYSVIWLASLSFYIFLMLYQGYHTITDILTTMLMISLLFIPLVFLLCRNKQKIRGMN